MFGPWVVIAAVILLPVSVKSIPDAVLTSSHSPLEGAICPMAVEFTCTIEDVPTLRWFFNGVQVARYSHDESNTFPRNVSSSAVPQGMWIQITSAVPDSSNTDNIAANSVLTTDTTVLSEFNMLRIQCGSSAVKSENITIGTIHNLVPSPSPVTACYFHPSSEAFEVTLQWSHNFTSLYAVERYNVSVTPDPSSCSSDQVSPSENYSCFIDPETDYSIAVNAINCGNQKGTSVLLNFNPPAVAVPEDVIDKVFAIYNKSSLKRIEIKWLNYLQVENDTNTIDGVQCSQYRNVHFNSTVITVQDSSGGFTKKMLPATTNDCISASCSTSFFIVRPEVQYSIFLSASDTFGRITPTVHYPNVIDGFSNHSFHYSVNVTNGVVSVWCESRLRNINQCTIQFSTDPLYSYLSRPTIISTNVITHLNHFPFELTKKSPAVYYHQASFVLTSTLEIVVRSNDVSNFGDKNTSNEDENIMLPCNLNVGTVMLEVYQLALLGVMIVILLLALVVSIGVVILLYCKVKKNKTKGIESYYDGVCAPNVLISQKASPSSYQDVALTTTKLPTKDADNADKDAVYDEIPESVMRPLYSRPVTTKPNEIPLKDNAAYQKGLFANTLS